MRKMVMIGAAALAAAGAALPAAGAQYWDYGAWHVAVEEVDTGEDLRRSCTAYTGYDGDPGLKFSFSNGDAGPPDFFPDVIVHEYAMRHYQTVMRDGDAAYVRFDDEDTMEAVVRGYLAEDVFENAEIVYSHPVSLYVLEAMRRNYQMEVVVNHKVLHTFYLDGFTAAYLKAAEECGFTGAGLMEGG